MENVDDDFFDAIFDDANTDAALPSSSVPNKPFSRAGIKFQPKAHGPKPPKPEPDPIPPTTLEVPPDVKPSPPLPPPDAIAKSETDGPEPMDVDKTEPMDLDDAEVEDEVVREIDVFFNPNLGDGTQLFLMQYPLRPSWRPYGLDRRCKEVKIKPKKIEFEFGLAVDKDNENYDRDAEEHLKTPLQILSGSKVPLISSYAVGILKGNELHLNPVNAAVQLRPVLDYVTELKSEPSSISNKGKQQKPDQVPDDVALIENEDWLPIEFHPFESHLSSRYRQKMLAQENCDMHFSMNPVDYLSNLCPGATADIKRKRDPSKQLLLSLPPDERFKLWFTQGGHIHRFSALMHLVVAESMEDVLKILPKYAHLVQGLWISKSSLLYEGREAAYREYVLFLFSRSTTIPAIKIPDNLERIIMPPLARKRSWFNDWKFSEPPDQSFMKSHPEVVAEQEYIWSSREKSIINALGEVGRGGLTSRRDKLDYFRANGVTSSSNVDTGSNLGKNLTEKKEVIISPEVREALPKAIRKVLIIHRVCGLSTICQHLRDMALSESQLQKRDPSASIAAAIGFINPSKELKDIIDQVALSIHDVYILKSVGNATVDSFRNIVIDLLRKGGRSAKLKKDQILGAAKSALDRDISNAEYKQVLTELCVNKGGWWVLKSGDGKPD